MPDVVRHLIKPKGKRNLRARLRDEAIANADRDLALAAEWFPLKGETCKLLDNSQRTVRRKRATYFETVMTFPRRGELQSRRYFRAAGLAGSFRGLIGPLISS